MALTLTQTAILTKRALLFSGIGLFLLITGLISYRIYYYKYYLPSLPPIEVKPDISFGVLPKPAFPENSISSSNYSYTLNTETGGLPTDIPKIMKVYFVPQLGTTFLATDKASQLASSLLFGSNPKISNDTQYGFDDGAGGNLNIDLVSGNFSFERASSSSATINQLPILPDQPKLISDFKTYLNTKNLLADDLKNGRSSVLYNLSSQKDATEAAITIWPDNLNNLEITTPDFESGLIKATVSKATDEFDKYLNLNYIHWSPDQKNSSTYPIKSPQSALDDLKNGQGVVIIKPKSPQVSITSIRLAYFETYTYTPYIEPIYVFEGEGFVAYVAAVSSDNLSK